MSYPTPSEYVEALQFPEVAFVDPVLASGEVVTNAMGLPRVITGAHAAVFRVERPDSVTAVRCFLTAAPGREKRYRAIEHHLRSNGIDALTRPRYLAEGVRVGERTFPIVAMDWQAGRPLDAYVESHLGDREALLALRGAWVGLLRELAASGVTHGDLQHGNILVESPAARPRLKLIDYDAMWVDGMKREGTDEIGHRNYQHPDAGSDTPAEYFDRFPSLVIATALTALVDAPELWERFSTGENMLFRSEDFLDPRGSALFDVLGRLDAPAPLAKALERACLTDPRAVPSVDDVLAGRASAITVPLRARQRGATSDAHRGRSHHDLAWSPFIVAVAVVVLLMLGQPFAGLLVGALALVAWSVVFLRRYEQLPAVRRRRRLTQEAAVLRRWVDDLEDQLQELERERTEFVTQGARLRERRLEELRAAILHDRLKHHFIGELSDAGDVGHRVVVRLKGVGIRNAWHATPDQVVKAGGVGESARRAVGRWRTELLEQYSGELPTGLSAAEERRLQRSVERRLQSLAEEMHRVATKADLQRNELAHVQDQCDALDDISRADFAKRAFGLPLRRTSI